MIIIPKKNCNIFKFTSLWMLIPIYYSYNTVYYLFSYNLILNLICSLVHWNYYKYNSLYHNLDRILSTNTLLIINLNTNNNIIYILTFLVVIFYYKGKQSMLNNNNYEQLVNHLIFRYIAFWECYLYINQFNYYYFKLYSILYILSICIINKLIN
jgi:hypothetical protein